MTKKLLSSMLSVAMLSAIGSVGATSASAEEYDITGGEITFRITDDWKYDNARYYIHIWDGREGGLGLYEWQTQNELMTIAEDGETATYNVPAGDWNLMILSNSLAVQTSDTVFNQNCIGDTFTVVADQTVAPSDDSRKPYDIVWDNNPDCGRHRRFNSSGIGVVGHAYIPGETDQTIFEDYCEYFGPQEDGTFLWDEMYNDVHGFGWLDAKREMAKELGLNNIAENIKSHLAENYGVKRGLPVTPDMEIPERYSTDFMDNIVIPGDWLENENCYYYKTETGYTYIQKSDTVIPEDWDGYYNVYYFEAPDEWVNAHRDKKEEGFEIGFYWCRGIINNSDSLPADFGEPIAPGVPAKKLSVIDQNGNDIYADRNIYYGFAPTFAADIAWNNGVRNTEENEQYLLQATSICVSEPRVNKLAEKIFLEKDTTIEGTYVAGCLFYEPELVQLGNLVYIPKAAYFDPNTGESTDEPLKDANGNYVTIPDEYFGYAKLALNPYYDMDYTYVNEFEAPTEKPTEAPTEAPTQQATTAPTNAPTEKPTQAPTQAPAQKPTQAPTNAPTATQPASNGTVATADNNAVKVLSTVLLLSVAGVAVSKRRKFNR